MIPAVFVCAFGAGFALVEANLGWRR